MAPACLRACSTKGCKSESWAWGLTDRSFALWPKLPSPAGEGINSEAASFSSYEKVGDEGKRVLRSSAFATSHPVANQNEGRPDSGMVVLNVVDHFDLSLL